MPKHMYPMALLAFAIAWFVFFGIMAPERLYGDPRLEAEVAADTTTVIFSLLKLVAPWLALIIAGYAVLVFFRERRR